MNKDTKLYYVALLNSDETNFDDKVRLYDNLTKALNSETTLLSVRHKAIEAVASESMTKIADLVKYYTHPSRVEVYEVKIADIAKITDNTEIPAGLPAYMDGADLEYDIYKSDKIVTDVESYTNSTCNAEYYVTDRTNIVKLIKIGESTRCIDREISSILSVIDDAVESIRNSRM